MVEFQMTIQECSTSPTDGAQKGDRPHMAYGVKFLEEKENRMKLLKLMNVRQRLPLKLSRNKSTSDIDSGFDSIDSGSGSSSSTSGNASSPASSESSVTLDLDSPPDEDAWLSVDYPFENLAMSGGGAKGYAYIGALKALEDSGALCNIRRIVGTSAGAVIGGMLVVGGTPQEIANFFKCDVKKLFQDKNTTMCLFLPRLLTRFGVNSGHKFYEMYGDFLRKKTGDADITFEEVYNKFGNEMCVTVTNLSRMCSEYCHYTTTPDLPIRKAIKISMAFPGVYESMKMDLFGNGTNMYVDGGTLENFPVQYFDEVSPESSSPVFNEKTIGLYLISEDQFSHKIWMETFQSVIEPFPSYLPDTKIAKDRLKDELKRRKKKDKTFDAAAYIGELNRDPYYKDGKPYMRHFDTRNKELIDIKGPKNYFRAMLSTLLLSQKHMLVNPRDLKRTIGINCGYIDTKDTTIEPGDREFMIRQGYEQTKAFLDNFKKNHPHLQRNKKPSGASPIKRPQSLPSGLASYGSVLARAKFQRPVLPSPSENDESPSTPTVSSDRSLTSSQASTASSTPTGSFKDTRSKRTAPDVPQFDTSENSEHSAVAFRLSYSIDNSPVVMRSKSEQTTHRESSSVEGAVLSRSESTSSQTRPESVIDLSESIFTKL